MEHSPPPTDADSQQEVQKYKEPHCFFIPGITGTQQGIENIKTQMEDIFGKDEVGMFASGVSTDPLSDRYPYMFDTVKKVIGRGEMFTIIANSLGSNEVIQMMKLDTEGFFDKPENAEKLNVVFISAASMHEGGLTKLPDFLKRTQKFTSTMPDAASGDIHEAPSPANDGLFIESLNQFPLTGVEPATLQRAMKELVLPVSSAEGKQNVDTFPYEQPVQPDIQMSEDDKKKLASLDGQLAMVLNKDELNMPAYRLLATMRAQLLLPYMKAGYLGEKTLTPPVNPTELVQALPKPGEGPIKDPTLRAQFRKTVALISSTILGIPILKDMVSGSALAFSRDLLQKGAKVTFLVPEYDYMCTLDNLQNLGILEDVIDLQTGRLIKGAKAGIIEGVAHSSYAAAGNTLKAPIQATLTK